MIESDGAFIARCKAEIQQCVKSGLQYWQVDKVVACRLVKLAGRVHWFASYPMAHVAIGLAEELARLAERRLLDAVTARVQNS